MKFIVQSKIHGAVTVQVDPQDAHLLRMHVWNVHANKNKYGDQRLYLRRIVKIGVTTALHREIVDAAKDEIVRFRNGDQLDMRRDNLIKEPVELARAHLAHHMHTVCSLYRTVHAYA